MTVLNLTAMAASCALVIGASGLKVPSLYPRMIPALVSVEIALLHQRFRLISLYGLVWLQNSLLLSSDNSRKKIVVTSARVIRLFGRTVPST